MAQTIKLTNGELRTDEDEQVSVTTLADLGDLVAVPGTPTELTTVPTDAATSSTPFGYTEAQANAIVTQLNNVIAALIAAGLAEAPA